MKFITKKISMAALITSTLMLSGCGSNNTDKPTEESTADVEKEDEIPFEKMTEEEMDVLVDGDVVAKLPNSEYLNKKGLDFIYIYTASTIYKDGEKPIETMVYYTDKYSKDFEAVAADYTNKHELKEIYIGSMVYSQREATGKWTKDIKTPEESWFTGPEISQEKKDELDKKSAGFNK